MRFVCLFTAPLFIHELMPLTLAGDPGIQQVMEVKAARIRHATNVAYVYWTTSVESILAKKL